tara:strand:+ start:237 stop:1532 length:1296 start_codon:yes stop_codon:yes gene_type:complete
MKNDAKKIVMIYFFSLIFGYLVNAITTILLVTSFGYIFYLHSRIKSVLVSSKRKTFADPYFHANRPDNLQELESVLVRLRLKDQTRKKKIRGLLKEFREATKALPDAILTLDNQDRITWTNKAALKQLGIKTPDDIGMRMTNVLRDPEIKKLLGPKKKEKINIKSPLDSEKTLEFACLLYGQNNKLIVGRDVTHFEIAENMRTAFVANVSHELRSPITVFKGYIEELIRRQDEAPKNWAYPMKEMHEQAKKMEQLVDELLLLSRLQSKTIKEEFDKVDVCALINQAIDKAKLLSTPKKHFYSLDTLDSLLVNGLKNEIYIIVSNIIFNAARYTPNNGVIEIKWFANKQGAHFQVKDNGIGISEENLPRITERFFRVENSKSDIKEAGKFNNTGLGLALVKHSVIKNKGTLKIESTINQGSIFTVSFPSPEN